MPTEVMESKEQKLAPGLMRVRSHKTLVPRTDIYESADQYLLLIDMPGVKKDSVDITLEQNILNIYGAAEQTEMPGYSLSYSEHEFGDYGRVFTLSNEIDTAGIEASVKNGVLKLVLPKSKAALPQKIAIKAQ